MRIRFAFTLALLLAATSAVAQFDAPVVPPKIDLQGVVTSRSGERVEGVITVDIPAPWHVNSAQPVDEFAIPTLLTIDPASARTIDIRYPKHELKNFTFSGGSPVAVYEGKVQIGFTAEPVQGAREILATLRYQACDDKVCLPPKTISGSFPLTVGAAPPAAPSPAEPAASFTPLTAAPANPVAAPPKDRVAATFASQGLPVTLLVLFVLGMALNLTPCVFPMIPITLGFFAMQSDGRRSRRLALSATYVLGIVIMYSSLGVVAALGGKMFGAWLQQPAVQIGFALLMLVLATSMFGAFDITVPQFIANRAMGRAGVAGALTMGLLVGIVAAPCVGPVVVSLISLVANIGKPSIGFVMFAALALGLGFPYLALLNALPRPGEWMVQVKKAMGFVLVAMAFYFLRPLIGDVWFYGGAAAALLVGSAFLFLKTGRSEQARALRIACASILLVGGVTAAAFAVPRKSGSELSWQPFEASALVSPGQPVIIDFYADWCIPCKELDAKTFSDPRVAAELSRFKRVKADLTLPDDPKTQELTRQYRIVGVPTVVFLDSNGAEAAAQRLTGFEGPEPFLARARQVR